MRAGRTEAGEINRFPTPEFIAHSRDPRIGKWRSELMKARRTKRFRRQPSRDAEAAFGKLWMLRSRSFVRVQFASLGRDKVLPCINHKWRRATMLFHPAE